MSTAITMESLQQHHPSFSIRRPAASSLPGFTLPSPSSEIPRVTDGLLSPISSGVHNGSSQTSTQAPVLGSNYAYHYGHGGWATANGHSGSSYTYAPSTSSLPSMGQHNPSPVQQHAYSSRQPLNAQSPAMQYATSRTAQSPVSVTEGIPSSAPPYDSVHHGFGNGTGTAGGASSNPPTLSSQGPPSHHSSMLGTQTPSTQPPAPSSAPAHIESYSYSRAPVSSGYYTTPVSTPQQPSFPTYSPAPQTSPTQHSPTTPGAGRPGGLGSLGGPHAVAGMAPPHAYGQRPYSGYPMPSGAMLSNLANPGGQMSIVPGMSVAPTYHQTHPIHSMYTTHPPQPVHQDRPFKCEQCPQSFNRNHDLKRHKRIHLAVKPFPCNHCDKAFSRKDALKRHLLVKNCGGSKMEEPRPKEEEHSTDGISGDSGA